MRRVRLLVPALLVAAMLMDAGVPASPQEWIQTNSMPSYLLWCDWWWNPQNSASGQGQWKYWCYSEENDFWVRDR